MTIKELVNKYVSKGYNFRNAQNLAAEEILLTRIAASPLANHVTLKGGIVMFNLTGSDRRVTQDIDFDFIRYSIDESSIRLFVDMLNRSSDYDISIKNNIEQLHQEDYQGVRVNLIIKDSKKDSLKIKLDIGVHTYSAIDQETTVFSFEGEENSVSIKVNPPEQIFAEKLLSLARLGTLSTRFKDVYDLYYLIAEGKMNSKKVTSILNLFFASSKRKPNDIYELQNSIEDTLNNNDFALEASKPASKWIDVDYKNAVETIIVFTRKL